MAPDDTETLRHKKREKEREEKLSEEALSRTDLFVKLVVQADMAREYGEDVSSEQTKHRPVPQPNLLKRQAD